MTVPPATPSPVPDLRHWMFGTVLPFWADVGLDRERGGFVERLTLDGRPAADDYKRIRVQARQIYSFCHAQILGAPDWAATAAGHGFDFLRRFGWDAAEGGWFHLLARDGTPLDRTKDCYDQAFLLLAFAWLHRATGAPEPLDWAERTIAFLDDNLADPRFGGYLEQAGGETAAPVLPRRQNPHMHLLEAFLALHEATGAPAWLDRAGRIIALFESRFFDVETGTLGEFFTEDWQVAPGEAGQVVEPGHHFEWVWLLHHYARLSGERRLWQAAERLYRFGVAHGVDHAPGMVPAAFDAVDRSGAVVTDTKRMWPQTEAVKAGLARAEFRGDAEAAGFAERHLAMMFGAYVSADHALWRDQITRDGRECSNHVPASTLYHLFVCITEAMRVLPMADRPVA